MLRKLILLSSVAVLSLNAACTQTETTTTTQEGSQSSVESSVSDVKQTTAVVFKNAKLTLSRVCPFVKSAISAASVPGLLDSATSAKIAAISVAVNLACDASDYDKSAAELLDSAIPSLTSAIAESTLSDSEKARVIALTTFATSLLQQNISK